MTTNDIPEHLWTPTAWEGSRRTQLRRGRALSLREKLQAIKDIAALSERFAEMRRRRRAKPE